MFCFNHLGPTSVTSGDRERARKMVRDKSHTNLHQIKCAVDIVHSKQESLEKLKQSGSKANSTLEPGQKCLFSLKMKNLHRTYISRKLGKGVTRKKLQTGAGESQTFKEFRSSFSP